MNGPSIDTLESAASSGAANEKSLDVNSWTTVENFTALHVAAHSGHTDLIELLLAKYKVCEQAPPLDFNAITLPVQVFRWQKKTSRFQAFEGFIGRGRSKTTWTR